MALPARKCATVSSSGPNIPQALAAVGAKRLARPLIATKPSLVDRQSADIVEKVGNCGAAKIPLPRA
jgi:hypothetical protein